MRPILIAFSLRYFVLEEISLEHQDGRKYCSNVRNESVSSFLSLIFNLSDFVELGEKYDTLESRVSLFLPQQFSSFRA